MATTTKTTKKNTKKHGKRYMKKAARRTIAALLMVTALIVAAIPATPGSAAGPTDPDTIRNRQDANFIRYDDIDNKTRFYFEKVDNPGYAAITFVGFDTLEIQPDGTKTPTTPAVTDIDFANKIVVTEGEEQKEYVCVAVAGELLNFDKIRSFSCPTVEEVNAGFAPSAGNNETLESFEGSKVSSIATGAFKNCTKLGSVKVGSEADSTTVGNEAFYGCTSMTLYEGRNTKNVGDKAFFNCGEMKNCYVSSEVDSIGSNAFSNSNLENFPDLTIKTAIGSEAFSNTKIKNLNITGPDKDSSETAVALSDGLFKGCTELSSVEFEGKFSSLGADTFSGCSGLQHVKLASPMKTIGSGAFDSCSSLNSLVLPGQITGGTLPAGLLKDCTSLELLTLENNEYENQDIDISNIFETTWLKSEACNLIVEGYRNYKNEAGNSSRSKAYKFCINNRVPYKCLDDEGGWADKYFDVDKDGKLIYVDIANYFADPESLSTSKHIEVPDSVHGQAVTGIATDAFKDINGGNVVTISTKSSSLKVEPEAFNYNSLIFVRFADESSQDISDTSNVFPSSGNFYIYGDIVADDSDTLNSLEYATKYNVEYRGSGKYDGDSAAKALTLVVKPVDGKATLVGALNQGEPAIGEGASYTAGSEKLSDLADDGAYINVPSGIKSIKDDFLKSDSYLKKIKTEGLTEIKDNQFQACTGIEDVQIGGDFSVGAFGKLPFKSAKVNNIAISDGNNVYTVDGQGVIYEEGGSGKTIVEGIESAAGDPKQGINGNESTRYVTPGDVVAMRESAFEDNKWIRTFSTVYDGNSGNLSNIETIPNRALYNAVDLAIVTLGSTGGKGYVQNEAFGYNTSGHMTNDSMSITVMNERMQYDSKAFTDTDDFIYNFYSKENDDTYDLCKKLKPNKKDNLKWHDIGTVVTQTLDNCKIVYPKTRYRDYTGNPYDFVKGNIIDTEDPDCADFAVQDPSGTIIDSTYYKVIGTITGVTGNRNFDTDVPFIIAGDGTHYSSEPSLEGKFVIRKKGGSSEDDPGDLEGYKIVFPKGTTLPYTGSQYTIKSLDEKKSASDSNYGEFYVINTKAPYDVLKESERYTFSVSPSPVKERGSYKITVTSNADGKISADFVVSGDDPGPTPGLYKLSRIEYPSDKDRGGQTRYYQDGRKYNLVAGYDFIVYGTDEKVVDPSEYYVYCDDFQTDAKKTTIKDVVGDPLKTVEVPFTVETTPSSNYAASSVAGKFFIKPKSDNDGDFTIRLPIIDDIGFAEWTGSVIEPEPVVYSKTDSSTVLEIIKHYTLGYPDVDAETGPNNKDMGTNKGVVYVYGTGIYDGKTGLRYFNIRKSIPKYVSSTDKTNKITFTVTNGRYYTGKGDIKIEKDVDDGTEKKEEGEYARGTVSADVELTDATTGKKLVEGVDYTLSFKKESGMNGTVTVTGMGNYFGTFTSSKFPLKKNSSSSSSGTGGGGNNSSSSSSSSSSKSSSSSSSSSGGSSSSSSGSGSSSGTSGSENRNSGTTVVNRNYYNSGNGGTVDELDGMLRAAHIDSINGGSADGYQVNITKSDAADAAFREALLRRYGSLDNIRYFSMDISLKDQNGNDIDTTGMSVTLTLPLPTSMEQYGTNNMIATVDGNGDLEDLNVQFSTLEGRPCATFVAPHFSPYGFYVNTSNLAVGTLDNTPKTGDPISPKWFLSFGLAALSIFLFLKKDPRPQAAKAA